MPDERAMDKEIETYSSYLLRLYRSEVHGRPAWRASLESTRTGERCNFSLPGLVGFLLARFGPAGQEDRMDNG